MFEYHLDKAFSEHDLMCGFILRIHLGEREIAARLPAETDTAAEGILEAQAVAEYIAVHAATRQGDVLDPEFRQFLGSRGLKIAGIENIPGGDEPGAFYMLLLSRTTRQEQTAEDDADEQTADAVLAGTDEALQHALDRGGLEAGSVLQSFLRLSAEAAMILNISGEIMYHNQAAEQLLNETTSDLKGRSLLSYLEQQGRNTLNQRLKPLLNAPRQTTINTALRTRYRKRLEVKLTLRSFFKDTQFAGALALLSDQTAIIRSRERINDLNNSIIEARRIIGIERERVKQNLSVLEELNRLKGDFVANISHELRTPLASIIGFSETIDSDPDMPEEMRREFNQFILTESKKLAKLINDVLETSRLEGGSNMLEKSEFDIIDELKNAAHRFKKTADEKNLHIVTNLPSDPVIIFADPERIGQLFDHLLSNAVKFTPENGRISLIAQLLQREIEIIFSDTGIGIPRKDIPFLFQKFFRAGRNDTAEQGPGLGLSLAKQIVDLHKGFITIQSEEDRGTTVILKLPLIN